MEKLKIGTRIIEYELHKSSKAKRVSITIKNQKVRVAVPTGFTFDYARKFLEENKDLLLKHLQKQETEIKVIPPKKYVVGEKFLYRGRNYPLVFEECTDSKPSAAFHGSRIVAYIPSGLTSENQSILAEKLIEEWYLEQAKRILPEQVEYYSKTLNIPYNKLKIKDQKTRWGSCSTKGNLNLNWRIIKAPNPVAAYVIIHELVHIRYMNHSKEFWKTVEQYHPNYRKCKKWLIENSNALIN